MRSPWDTDSNILTSSAFKKIFRHFSFGPCTLTLPSWTRFKKLKSCSHRTLCSHSHNLTCWHRLKKVGVAVKQSGRGSNMKIYAHFHSSVIFVVTAGNNLRYLNDPKRYHGRFVCNSNKRRRMDISQILGCSGLIHSIYFHQRSSIISSLHCQFWDATRWCFRSFIS